MKALLINGYESYEGIGEGRLNASLIQTTKEILENKGYEVKVTNVEKGYDVEEEHDKTIWADVVFVQFPMYWFNVPAKLKEYIDKVYILGYIKGTMTVGDGRTRSDESKEYGSGGVLTDKKYMLSFTANEPASAFAPNNKFFEGLNLYQAMISLHKTYQFIGMNPLPSFAIFDVFKSKEGVQKQIEEFKHYIDKNF